MNEQVITYTHLTTRSAFRIQRTQTKSIRRGMRIIVLEISIETYDLRPVREEKGMVEGISSKC
jgi:hypothetical protein